MGDLTIYANSKTYADIDAKDPGSGLKLWQLRYGERPYKPEYIASLGAGTSYGRATERCERAYQRDEMGY